MATALMVNAKKGVSAKQLQRDLGTAYKTAWYLSHRIRKAMGLVELADEEPLSGTVEIDETYMGSKKYDKRRKRAKYGKEPVFGIVERDGRARGGWTGGGSSGGGFGGFGGFGGGGQGGGGSFGGGGGGGGGGGQGGGGGW